MTDKFNMNGVLFKNDKGGVEKRPDFRGEITVENKRYKLSAWIKRNFKGDFLSISAEDFIQKPEEGDFLSNGMDTSKKA